MRLLKQRTQVIIMTQVLGVIGIRTFFCYKINKFVVHIIELNGEFIVILNTY